MDSIILLVAMIAVFYFLIIRPENKRKKQAENMRNSLKKGERITTIGGLVGRIVQVNDATVAEDLNVIIASLPIEDKAEKAEKSEDKPSYDPEIK